MKLSELYGKRVESTQGKKGYVISVNAGGGTLECLICADENEKEFTVDVNNIVSVDQLIVFEDRETPMRDSKPLRLGLPVFDCEGSFLGKLNDFTIEKNAVRYAHVGRKKFSADDIVCGDAVLVKNSARYLRSDVKKDGKVLIRRGTPLTDEVLKKAQNEGEYVQTKLKSL